MSQNERCPQCGGFLPAGSGLSPCPACLMQLGLMADHDRLVEHVGAIPELGVTHISPPMDRPPPLPSKLPSPADLASLFPELQIIKLLGFGGMGAVYQARQTGLDRFVALKIIMPDVAGDPGFAERFTREARVLAKLSHPHIVTIHDFGQRAGLHFLIMEYVDGVNLREVLNSGRMAPHEALRIIPRLCEALQYAHEEGVVHRDVKPENILIDRKGRVKVADFGLARLAGRDSENYTLTGTRQVVGTPRYMAPEQMQGSRAVDHRADIYSLGVVFYEMLTGEVPIGRFPPPSHQAGVDARLDDVVLRALDSNPDRRYQRVSEIQNDVESISQGGYVSPPALHASGVQPAVDATLPAVFQLIAGSIQVLLSVGFFLMMLAEMAPNSRWLVLIAWLVFTGASAIFGLNAIAGAIHYMSSGSVRWLRIGAITMMIPTNVGWLVGLPIGIWVLIATSTQRSVSRRASPPLRYQGFAVALLILGFVEFVVVPVFFWVLLVTPTGGHDDGASSSVLMAARIFILAGVLASLIGGAKVITGIAYLSGGSVNWLRVGAVLMMIPNSMWMLEFPIGAWCLYLLFRDSRTDPGSSVVPGVRPPPIPVPMAHAAAAPATDPVASEPGLAYEAASVVEPVSQQFSVPWSGFGWVQKAVRRVPKQRRWPWFIGSLFVLIGISLALMAYSKGNLLRAAQSGSTLQVRFWLLAGSGVDVRDEAGMTPLMWAVWNQQADVVRQLLAAGADVHLKAHDGETALMKASFRGQAAIVEQLLKAGSVVNEADNDGETALALAAAEGNVSIVQQLLAYQADPRLATNTGWTPLIAAAFHGHDPVVNQLLDSSTLDATDRRGESALMKAAWRGEFTIVQTLVNKQANLNLENVDGFTALGLAIAWGRAPIVDLLVAKGATPSPLLTWYQGLRAGRQGQHAVAAEKLKVASSQLPLSHPCRVGTDDWRYEVESPECFVGMLISQCELRGGNADAAKKALEAAIQKVSAAGWQTVPLYRRQFEQQGISAFERVSVTVDEIKSHIQNPNQNWHLNKSRNSEERSDFHNVTQSGSNQIEVDDLFRG